MPHYATGTGVPVERSKAEIERVLVRYGASKFAYFSEERRAAVGFEARGRAMRMTVELPTAADFARTATGKVRTAEARDGERHKATRQRWRALVLIVKAKLEAVESGITTFETEWLAYMVLPNGRTVAEHVAPQLEEGKAPTLLLGMEQ